jgi:hypothetical protein
MPAASTVADQHTEGGFYPVSTALFHRRRAERLAQLLDEATGGPRHHTRNGHDEQLAGYVRLSAGLTSAAGLAPDPTPEFRASLRARLVATAEREGISATSTDDGSPDTDGKRGRHSGPVVGSGWARGAILIGLAVGTLALSGMYAASSNTVPGDALYSIKRSAESVRLALAGSDVNRGQLYLEFARNRLAEAVSVGAISARLSDLLEDMDNQTRAGIRLLTVAALERRDRTALDPVDGFVRGQQGMLAGLGHGARVRRSVDLLDRVGERSAGLRTGLACAGGTRVGQADDLGELAPTCRPAVNPGTRTSGGNSGTAPVPTDRPDLSGPRGPAQRPADPGVAGSTSPAPQSPSTSPTRGLLGVSVN